MFYNEGMKKIINIVEDEKDLNELVKSYLEKEGYIVNSYLTFDAAYSHIDDYCDLWILDIMLDDKSGFDLIEIIKNKNANIPVVFMSARDKEFDRIIGLEKGSDDYITKPFSPKELVLRVNNIIRRVYEEGGDDVYYTAVFEDGESTAAGIMQEWYDELAAANGKSE